MCAQVASAYNGHMTTHQLTPDTRHRVDPAHRFVDGISRQEFSALADELEPDAHLEALLPRGHRTWDGASDVAGAFEMFFGDMDRYDVVDTSVDSIGERLRLRWRLRVSGPRLGDGSHLVEQCAFADVGASGRIRSIALVCSGFCPVSTDEVRS